MRLARKMVDKAFTLLVGDDIFVSYSRRDGATYSAALANRLAGLGFSCRFDQWGTQPGKKIPEPLRKALRRSLVLVLVGTREAGESEAVAAEIQEFSALGRPIVPIEIDSSLDSALWWPKVEGLAISHEVLREADSASDLRPSDEVIARIENTFEFTRKDKRLRYLAGITLLVLLVLVALAVAAGQAAVERRAEAAEQTELANQQSIRAEQASDREREATESLASVQSELTILSAERAELVRETTRLEALRDKYQKLADDRREASKSVRVFLQNGIQALFDELQPSFECVSLRIGESDPVRIYFWADTYELSQSSKKTLQHLSECWQRSSNKPGVMVAGHVADEDIRPLEDQGTPTTEEMEVVGVVALTNEYALAIGDRRSSAVGDYLTSLGMGRNALRSISYGQEGRRLPFEQMNSRVDIWTIEN